MRRWPGLLVVVVLVLAGVAGKAGAQDYRVKADEIGVLQSCGASCTTGASKTGLAGDTQIPVIQVNGAAALLIQAACTATIVGVVEHSLDGGATWTVFDGGATWTTAATTGSFTSCPAKIRIPDPVGWYRTNITTCTGCTFTTRYYAAPRGLH